MKKNNKGFMLAEAVISGTVILVSMISLYATFSRLYSLYDDRMNYYDIDSYYATKLMINNFFNSSFNQRLNNIFYNSNSYLLIANGECQSINKIEESEGNYKEIDSLMDMDFCNKLQDLYNINTMIITEYDKSVLLEEVKNDIKLNLLNDNSSYSLNQTFKDYIDFVNNYYDVGNSDAKFSYIVLTEVKNGDSYYYANLGIG